MKEVFPYIYNTIKLFFILSSLLFVVSFLGIKEGYQTVPYLEVFDRMHLVVVTSLVTFIVASVFRYIMSFTQHDRVAGMLFVLSVLLLLGGTWSLYFMLYA